MNRTRRYHSKKRVPKIDTPNVSSQTLQILNDSWEKICSCNSISFSEVEIENIDTDHIKQIQLQSMYSGIPEDIRRHFESTSQRGIKTTFLLPRGRTVFVSILVPMRRKDSRSDFIEYLNRILLWLHFIDGVASPKCAQTLNVYLLLTDAKKKLPPNNKDRIDMIHANTAFTTACSVNNSIFVFRREEWFKVFIHETFHCFGLDFSSLRGEESNSRILSIFPAIDPNVDICLYETFCEMWAELFYMMFVLFYKPRSHKHRCIPFSSSSFLRILSREQIFSIYQSNKILRRSGYRYDELFAVPTRGKDYYTENTPAFSYYVIKSLMLWNLDRFMDWCVKYSNMDKDKERGGYPPIQFHIANVPKYCDLVRELTENDGNYGQLAKVIAVNPSIIQRKTGTAKYSSSTFILENTLRMTSIDIE